MNKRLLCLLLAGTGIFNICDFFLTLHVTGEGHGELNPVIKLILDTPLFPLAKLVLIPAGLLVIWLLRFKAGKRLMFYSWFMFISYALLMIYFSVVFLYSKSML